MLKPDDAFLLVIDVQGKLAEIVHDSEIVRKNVRRMVEGVRLFDMPIVVTEQVPEKLGPTAPDVAEALLDLPRLTKTTFSCWPDETIRAAIEEVGRSQVVVVGIECHVCVYQTVMDLLGAGFDVHLVLDAVGSRDPDNKEVACGRMSAEGAHLTTTEMLLFELQYDCLGDRFRALSRLVK